MDKIAYFKLQAKNLFRDFKTQTFDEEGLTRYAPRFFKDIDDILLSYDVDEENFKLMNAQHLIANLAGFKCWNELLHASDDALELGKLLLDKRNDGLPACMGDPLEVSWKMYLWENKLQNLPDRDKLAILRAFIWMNSQRSMGLMKKNKKKSTNIINMKIMAMTKNWQITSERLTR